MTARSDRQRAGLWQRKRRRGATMVETAIVLPIAMLLVMGIVDLGMAVHHRNALMRVVSHLAREATLHGSARQDGAPWGPETIVVSASADVLDPDAATLEVRELLTGVSREAEVRIDWPAATNHSGDLVSVTANEVYRPLFSKVLGIGEIHLRASCTLPISH